MVCIMKKNVFLLLIILLTGLSASCETLNYKIQQNGSSMVIVPYYSVPVVVPKNDQNIYSGSNIKIPYYENKKLPRGKNRSRNV